MQPKSSQYVAWLVGPVLLASAAACGSSTSRPAPSDPTRSTGGYWDSELSPYRSVDRDRERPAVRGGPVSPESVSGNSPAGVRPK
jgi:hypothetical protein